MGASDNDLKSQLSDIQKRLSEATFNSPKRSSGLRKEQNVPSSPDKSTSGPSIPDSSSTASKKSGELTAKKSLPNFLSKKEKRVSLPVLESSRSPTNKNTGKDMDFVVGLSENLLVQCRRLQAENQQKSTKLRSIEEEFTKLKNSNNGLMTKLNEVLQNEEKYKDTNWELELKLQQISQEYKTISENYTKAQKELNKQKDLSNDIRTELEEINLNKVTLENELNTNKVSVMQEIQSLKEHVDELNDVNYRLNDEIEELRKELEIAKSKPKPAPFTTIPSLKPDPDSESEDEFNEPPISPVKTIPMNNNALETETLKSSLSTAHQTISKLRKQILKLRENELTNKSQSPASRKPQIPVTRKLRLNELPARLGPNPARSSRIIIDDDSENEGDWENFDADDSTVSYSTMADSPSKKSSGRPHSVYSNVSESNELIIDSDSDTDNSENFPVAPLSSELHHITHQEVEKYAEENNLVLLPLNDYEKLSGEQRSEAAGLTLAETGIIALPNDDAKAKELTELDLIAEAKGRGLTILSHDEVSTKDYEIEQLTGKITVLQDNEQKYFREAEEYRTKLDAALSDIKKEKHLIRDLQAKLDTPSESYLKDKADIAGLALVPLAAYKALQSEVSNLRQHIADPSTEFLREKANSKNLKVLSNIEYSNLLAEAASLKVAISQQEGDKEDLVAKLSNISSTHEKALKDHEVVLASLSNDKDAIVAELNKELEAMRANLSKSDALLAKELEAKAELQSLINEPSVDYIKRKAIDVGYTTLTLSELEVLNNNITSLKEELSSNLAASTKKEESANETINRLKSKIDEPSITYLKEKATAKGFKLLEAASYEDELAGLNSEISTLQEEIKLSKEQSVKKNKISNTLIDELKAKLEVSQAERVELHDSLTALEQQVDSAHGEVSILKSQIDHPSHDYLHEKSTAQGLTILPILEHTSLLEKSARGVHELAKDGNYVVLDEAEHRELTEKATKPSIDHLVAAAKNLDHTMIPTSHYNDLVAKSNRTIQDHAKEQNFVLLDKDLHEKLVRKVQAPTVDELADYAKLHSHTIINDEKLSELNKKAAKSVEDLAKDNDLILLNSDDHHELLRKANEPSVEELSEHASSKDHVVIPVTEFEDLSTKASRSVHDLAKERNLILLSNEEHKELVRKTEKPSLHEVSILAGTLGLVTLASKDHDVLVTQSRRTVHDLAKAENSVVLPQDQHKELLNKLDNPDVEYLVSKADKLGHKVIPATDHSELVRKSQKSAKELAEEKSLILLTPEEHDNLLNPPAKAIHSKAEKVGLVAVPIKEHQELVQKVQAPDLQHLSDKANLLGYSVIPAVEYKELTEHFNSPSKDFIVSNAQRYGLVTFPVDEHQSHKEELSKLKKELTDKELLKEKVSSEGNVVIKQEDYDVLVEKANTSVEDLAKANNKVLLEPELYEALVNPPKDKIISHASKHNLVVIGKDDYQTLIRSIEAPTLDHLKEKANLHGHVVVRKENYDTLRQGLESPSVDFLTERAEALGLNVIKASELSQLKSKASATVDELALEEHKVLLSESEFELLKNPDKDTIIDKAKALGLVPLTKEDHASLIKSVESPDLNYINEKASAYACTVIRNDQLKELESVSSAPSVEFLAGKANALNLALVPAGELSELKSQASKSVEQLAKEKNLIAIPQEEHKSLLSPSKDTLLKAVTGLGFITVGATEHARLIKPTHADVTKHAESLNSVIVPKQDFKLLSEKANKSVQDLAKESNLTLLTPDEYKQLLQPSKDQIANLAASAGLVAIGATEYESLINPSYDFLKAQSEKQSLVLVKGHELDDLKKQASKGIDELAKETGSVVVSGEVYGRLTSPDKEAVVNHAARYGLITLTKEDHSALNNPSKEILQTHAERKGLKVLKYIDYESLLNPSREAIEEHALKNNAVLLSKDDYERLLKPSKNSIQEHAEGYGMVLLEEERYLDLVHPSKDALKKLAKSQNLITMDTEAYEELQAMIDHPTVDFLSNKAQDHDLVVVEKSKYDVLVTKSEQTMEELAKEQNVLIVSPDEFQSLKSPSIEDIQVHASKHGFVAIEKSQYKELLDKAEKPVHQLAAEQNLVIVPEVELQELRKPSIEKVQEHADSHGHITIDKAEFNELSSKAHKTVEELAAEKSSVVVPRETYESLNDPSAKFIRDHAATHGLITLHSSEKDAFIADHLNKQSLVSISTNKYDALRSGEHLSKDEVSKLCEKHDLKAIDSQAPIETTEEEIGKQAKRLGLVVIPRGEYDLLKAQAENPDRSSIEKHAALIGCTILGIKEYESLQNAVTKVSKSDLESKAKKIDHVIIPRPEYEELVTPKAEVELPTTPTHATKFEATKHYFENVSKSAEKDAQKAKVFDSARSLGFIPISADEYRQFLEQQKEHVITRADIYRSAREMNLSILPQEEYKSLLKDRISKDDITSDELHEIAKRFNLRLVPQNFQHDVHAGDVSLGINANQSVSTFQSTINEDEFEDALSRIPSETSTIHGELEISIEALQDHARKLGFDLVPIVQSVPELEYDNEGTDNEADVSAQNDTIVLKESPDDIKKKATELGLIVLAENEYEDLVNIDETKIHSKALELGLTVYDVEEAKELESWRNPQEPQLRSVAEKLNLVILTKEQASSLVEKGSAADITADNISGRAKELGLVVLSTTDYEGLKKKESTPTLTPEKLALAASALGLSVVGTKELDDCRSRPTELSYNDVVSGAQDFGLVTLTKDEHSSILSKANATPDIPASLAREGSISISTQEYDTLVLRAKYVDSDELMNAKLEERGLMTIPVADYESLHSNKLSKEEVTHRASELGLVVLGSDQYESLFKEPEITREDIVNRAHEFGLTVITTGEKHSLEPSSRGANTLLSRSDVVQKALEFDMVAISKEEFYDLREKAGSRRAQRDLELEEEDEDDDLTLTREQVEVGAKNYGLLAIPENAFVATNVSRIPDVNNVVVLPVTYYNKLTKSEVFNIEHVTNEELQSQAKKRGFQIVLEEKDFKEPLSVSRKSTITSFKSSNSRKNIADFALTSASAEYENASVRTSRATSRNASRNGSRAGSVNPPISRDLSIDGGISLMTDASLSEPKIIPALTQAVIGEYVYKYYRRLGPFSSISESRHERYFWIHPYTLTLYWSSTNPVLGNPSTHKTRAAAIVAVESVDDNNPLPTGLYHKSIVVHSQTRSVKFTCSTRQRHNIWYNSLRYLIQRSMDGIDLEEDFDELRRGD